MKEVITIKNFGGLKNIVVPLNSINIFIGKQASGKSITAKLLYFFKSVFADILSGTIEEKTKPEIDKSIREKFENYFPPSSWAVEEFYIKYEINDEWIELVLDKKKLRVSYSDKLRKHFTRCKQFIKQDKKNIDTGDKFSIYRPSPELNKKYYSYLENEFGKVACNNQVFIPAGRSFFASLQSTIFSLLSNNKSIDPFMLEFGSFYERFSPIVIGNFYRRNSKSKIERNPSLKKVEELIYEILGAEILRKDNKIYLVHSDKRRVELPFSSSGQQETLPLSLMLAFFNRSSHVSGGTTVYIEEPEAHLFPSAQKKIVELISTVYNNPISSLQFVITTHSPYILTSFNNLLHAGMLLKEGVDKNKVGKIIPLTEIIRPGELNAFAMKNGKLHDMIDEETGLISATLLDQVSEDIAVQFDELISL